MKTVVYLLALLISTSLYSQCLETTPLEVINPSFEGPPGSHITPAPWSTCGITPDTQPGSWGVSLPPSNGSTYVGFVNGGSSWLEGASQQLNGNMTAGLQYTFTIDLAVTTSSGGGISPGPSSINIYGANSICNTQELLWSSGTISNTTWNTFTVTFTPTQNFSHLYFQIDAASANLSYILLDNITPIYTANPYVEITSHVDGDSESCGFTLAGIVSQPIVDSVVITGSFVGSPLTTTMTTATDWTSNLVFTSGGAQTITATLYYLDAVTNQVACSYSDVDITIESPTTAIAFANNCENIAISFTDNTVPFGTTTISTWSWDFGDGGTSTVQNPTYTYTSPGNFNVTVDYTTSDGCTASITEPITIHPEPVSNFTFINVCDTDPISFTNTTGIFSGAITTYAWDFGDATGTSANTDETYTYAAAGLYNVSLTSTSDNGCIHSVIHQVEIFNNPTAEFTFTDVCDQELAQFTNTSLGNGGTLDSYQWDFTNDGTIDQTNLDAAIIYPSPGTYTVYLGVETIDGCTNNTTHDIIVHPTPVTQFTGQNLCEGNSVQFTNNSNISSGTIATFDWDFGTGAVSHVQDPLELFNNEGIYTVSLLSTSDQGCVSTDAIQIEIYPTPVPQFITADVCDGTIVNFTDFSNVSNTYTTNTITNWDWNFGDSPAGIAVGSNTSYLYNSDGTYTVTLDITTNNGCSNSIQQNVIVHPNPIISFTSPEPNGCTEHCVNFQNNTTITSDAISSYIWDFGNGNASIDNDPTECYSNESLVDSTFDVTLTATSSYGCQTTNTEIDFVTVYPLPIADFEPSKYETDIFLTEIDFENTSQIGNTYFWDIANLQTSTDESPSYIFPDNDSSSYEICLETSTIHNCLADTCKTIFISGRSNTYIPNTFTPNGDGKNDVFRPSLFGISDKDFTFYIFNRWGTLLYISTNPENAFWDGTYKGVLSQEDTYIWKISVMDKYTNETNNIIGHVNLIK